ncbi:MAG: DUF362 domain-containing protein [Candidatus Baldrarchaeota archaeon]
MERVAIIKIENDDVYGAVKKAIEAAGQPDLSSGDTVIVKPNLCAPKPYNSGVITNIEVIKAVCKYLIEEMNVKPLVGDMPIVGWDPKEVYQKLGVKEEVEKVGAQFLDFSEEEFIKIEIPDGKKLKSVKILKKAFEVDGIISVPVMKDHFLTGVTLSIKNLKGLIAQDQRTKVHVLGLHEPVVDLFQALKNQVKYAIVDGTYAANQVKPSGPYYGPIEPGEVVKMDLIIAGKDPVAVDAVTSRVMGFDPTKIKIISIAAERGLGEIENIEVVGEEAKPFKKFKASFKGRIISFMSRIWTAKVLNPLVNPLAKKLFGPQMVTLSKAQEEVGEGKKGEVVLIGECDGCGVCVKSCKVNNIKLVNGKPVIGDRCIKCFICVEVCPKSALAIQ